MRWHVHNIFHRMPPGAVAGGIAVVIDVLRASTTMVTALEDGAAAVWPVAAVDDARRLAERLGPAAVLGGERGGERIRGFDLGNSPLEYTRDRIGGRDVVITTTNGTAAIAACAAAAETLVGAIVNRQAVAQAIRRLAMRGAVSPTPTDRVAEGSRFDVHLVCAGTDGEVSAEDVLGAGAILEAALAAAPADDHALDHAAAAALAAFRQVAASADPRAALVAAFQRSPGGMNLLALGMDADLDACARIDTRAVVPRLDRASPPSESRATGRAVRFEA
jgi:2-phosphosulfolactate phosphatase